MHTLGSSVHVSTVVRKKQIEWYEVDVVNVELWVADVKVWTSGTKKYSSHEHLP